MTLLEEAIEAGRGILALLQGRRDAYRYFNLTTHGLVGSFVGLLVGFFVSSMIQLYGPVKLQDTNLFLILVDFIITYAGTTLTAAVVLKYMNRYDRLVPYLVAGNWSGAVGAVLSSMGLLFGPGALFTSTIVSFVAMIVVEINIIRIIVGLRSWAIAGLITAQLLCLILLSLLF